jgi:hypothetical protein
LAGYLEFVFSLFNWPLFFQFNHSTSSWLGIRLHDLFWFVFYEVLLASWLESRVWRVNPADLSFFFKLFDWHFLYFMIRHWFDCELGFMICFVLLSMRLSSLMLESRVLRVNLGRLKLFHCVLFLNWFFFHFQPLIMSLLKIKHHNLFWFSFNRVITISWPSSQVRHINPG